MDIKKTGSFVGEAWRSSIIPALMEFIRIPNKSPLFDPQWQDHGHMDKAIALIERWSRTHPIDGMTFDVVRLEGRTPLLFFDIPGASDDCVLLYGHMDKQPEMTGWREGLNPWDPVIHGDKLYGRGGADDGYAVFSP
jgi:acetylornithine deacetylase/succinyl-diaminopimelate desuccinylase-like protein